jgi:hypothetical protein
LLRTRPQRGRANFLLALIEDLPLRFDSNPSSGTTGLFHSEKARSLVVAPPASGVLPFLAQYVLDAGYAGHRSVVVGPGAAAIAPRQQDIDCEVVEFGDTVELGSADPARTSVILLDHAALSPGELVRVALHHPGPLVVVAQCGDTALMAGWDRVYFLGRCHGPGNAVKAIFGDAVQAQVQQLRPVLGTPASRPYVCATRVADGWHAETRTVSYEAAVERHLNTLRARPNLRAV